MTNGLGTLESLCLPSHPTRPPLMASPHFWLPSPLCVTSYHCHLGTPLLRVTSFIPCDIATLCHPALHVTSCPSCPGQPKLSSITVSSLAEVSGGAGRDFEKGLSSALHPRKSELSSSREPLTQRPSPTQKPHPLRHEGVAQISSHTSIVLAQGKQNLQPSPWVSSLMIPRGGSVMWPSGCDHVQVSSRQVSSWSRKQGCLQLPVSTEPPAVCRVKGVAGGG